MDKKLAIKDPASQFNNPNDVLEQKELTAEEKIAVLRQWDYDTREILVAEEENMSQDNTTPGTDYGNLLRQIHQCLLQLGDDSSDSDDNSSNGSQTKQG